MVRNVLALSEEDPGAAAEAMGVPAEDLEVGTEVPPQQPELESAPLFSTQVHTTYDSTMKEKETCFEVETWFVSLCVPLHRGVDGG